MEQLYVFIDNSFLFIQGYKHVQNCIKIPYTHKPTINYKGFKSFFEKNGEIRRIVLVGSELSGSISSNCQRLGFEIFNLPRYQNFRRDDEEKGVDHKICWEIAKTIFTNKETTHNKKIILCSGDKDFISILHDIHTSNWQFELWLWSNAYSKRISEKVRSFGDVKLLDSEWKYFISIKKRRPN